MYNKIRKIHFIGIGGIGMSGIAELLRRHGFLVTGSDKGEGESVRILRKLGIPIAIGHDARNIEGAELVVISSAVRAENPEVMAAQGRGIPVIPRAEMLAELMRMKYGIAVAGAHGKTTTTSMISWVLVNAGLDPTIIVGGRMDNFGGTNARLGNGEFMVAEADESDGSFNRLSPSIAIVTNLDREHMDYFRSMQNLRKAFVSFLNKVPFYGLSVLCQDDPSLRVMRNRLNRRVATYGFHPQSDFRVLEYVPSSTGSESRLVVKGEVHTLRLRVPGRHNVLNALATLVVAEELGVSLSKALEALAKYEGVRRRFQLKGRRNEISFIDDYAHHPTEIRATLAAARERFPSSKIHVIFQPHRFSRVQDLFEDFARSFGNCDRVIITDIYSAGETPIEGVTGSELAESIERQGGRSQYRSTPQQAMETCLNQCAPNDVVLTLGAGDLPNVYRSLF
ncbi:MAG: UDP-N-acetylmuramate--L-alanine ligase [Deltaproteobacteria bacterium]|nr:UDP-N-acetylmuramate--L-alanine ligase [Deltaproteobacteria bacterium]MBI3295979.1 UDP-N-acetylmuramate--L-alanine ligase [Deltaproteobacteria bacterium]